MTVTLLTGASSGIGRSLALRLSDDPLALVARRKALLDTLAAEIEAGGGRALALSCDVTERAQVSAAVAAAEGRFGPIERLIANAGGGRSTDVERFRAAEIEQILALNVVGVANCIEAVLPGMLARGAKVEITADRASADAARMEEFLAALPRRHAGDAAILIVGHSNTVPELLVRLGASQECFDALGIQNTPDGLRIDGYEGLWVVDLAKEGCAAVTRRGARTGRAGATLSSANSSASFSVMAPANSSASTMVTARR